MNTLYKKIVEIAEPIVKRYHTDVTIHDRSTLASLQPGDVVLWACRESGSHIAWLLFADPTMNAAKRRNAIFANRSIWNAANSFWPGMQWYVLTPTDHDGRGTVERVSLKKAEVLFTDALDEIGYDSAIAMADRRLSVADSRPDDEDHRKGPTDPR